MANELTISVSVIYRKGADYFPFTPAQKQFTVTGNRNNVGSQVLSTTAEALQIGEISSAGWAVFHNLDSAINIHLSLDSGATNKFATIPPGGFFPLPLATTTIYASSASGTPMLKFWICEA